MERSAIDPRLSDRQPGAGHFLVQHAPHGLVPSSPQRPSLLTHPWLRLLLAILVIAVYLYRFDTSVWQSLGQVALSTLLLAVVLHLLVQGLGILRWASFAQPVGFEFSLRHFAKLYFEARFLSVSLCSPAPGDVWRAFRSATTAGGRLLAAATILADRLAGWSAICVIAMTALMQRWFELDLAPTLLVALTLVLATLALVSIGMGTVRFLIHCLPKGHDLRHLTSRLIPYQARPQIIWQALAYSFASQLLGVASVYCLGIGLGINAPFSAYCIAVPVTSLSLGRPNNALSLSMGSIHFGVFLSSYGVAAEQSRTLEQLFVIVSLVPALVGGIIWLRGGFKMDRSSRFSQWPGTERLDSEGLESQPPNSQVLGGMRGHLPRAGSRGERVQTRFRGVSSFLESNVAVNTLSVVIPVRNEIENLPQLYFRLVQELESIGRPYELIFVDDGSIDGSYQQITEFAAQDTRVKLIQLRRNFGQTAAMHAGISMAQGDAIVTIDADLQNDPADIAPMLAKLEQGYDVVHGWRKARQDRLWSRRVPSTVANWLISKVTHFPIKDLGCTLKIIRREIAQELPLYGEMHRFIPILANWRGARCCEMICKHHARQHGESKYGISRTFRVLLDLITVKYMIQYFTSPMKLFGSIGLLSFAVGGLAGLVTLMMKLSGGIDMTGNPLLLLTVSALFVGLQFLVLGMLGELGVRTYYESQNKQPYAIRAMANCHLPLEPLGFAEPEYHPKVHVA